jgi:hypothetical protein
MSRLIYRSSYGFIGVLTLYCMHKCMHGFIVKQEIKQSLHFYPSMIFFVMAKEKSEYKYIREIDIKYKRKRIKNNSPINEQTFSPKLQLEVRCISQ